MSDFRLTVWCLTMGLAFWGCSGDDGQSSSTGDMGSAGTEADTGGQGGSAGVLDGGVPLTDANMGGVPIDSAVTMDAAPMSDVDEDGVVDASDNCPNVYNPEQEDFDENGIGDG